MTIVVVTVAINNKTSVATPTDEKLPTECKIATNRHTQHQTQVTSRYGQAAQSCNVNPPIYSIKTLARTKPNITASIETINVGLFKPHLRVTKTILVFILLWANTLTESVRCLSNPSLWQKNIGNSPLTPESSEITNMRSVTTFYDTTLREFAIERALVRALVKPILTKRGTSTFIKNTNRNEIFAEIPRLIGALTLPRPTTTFSIKVGNNILTRTSFLLLQSRPSKQQMVRAVINISIEQFTTVP